MLQNRLPISSPLIHRIFADFATFAEKNQRTGEPRRTKGFLIILIP